MKKNILVLLAIFTLYSLGYLTGSFSKEFDLNLCYSNILSNIQKDVNYAVKTKDINDILKIEKKLKLLPNRGYESNCEEISKFYTLVKGT